MVLQSNIRRGISLAIPLFTALFLFGIINSIFDLTSTQSLIGTGMNLNIIFGILNVIMWWLAFKHQIP